MSTLPPTQTLKRLGFWMSGRTEVRPGPVARVGHVPYFGGFATGNAPVEYLHINVCSRVRRSRVGKRWDDHSRA